MPHFHFLWTDQIIRHIAEHGLTPEDFEYVVRHPISKGLSRSTGLPVVWGHAQDGRYIMTVFEMIDRMTVLPVTAYEVPEPR